MQYRRAFVPDGCFFFTLVTERRRQLLVNDETVDLLRQSFHQVMRKRPFIIDAAVILPDHLHCISFPPDDADFSTRWRLIKTYFTKHYDSRITLQLNASRMAKRQQAIWQHRFWEHSQRDEADFEKHVAYIHYNPVKHGYVKQPVDWPYSSIHCYIEQAILPAKWAASEMIFETGIGCE